MSNTYQYGGWSNMRMQQQPQQQRPQQPQIPEGWEAKWDSNSRRWFYVDHSTKTTHWELPSKKTQPSPAPQQVTTSFINRDPENVKILMSEYEGLDKEYVASLLRVYKNKMPAVRKTLSLQGYKKKTPRVEPKPQFVHALKGQYPTATEEIIKEILVNTTNNFVGTRTALESMGYKRKIEESVRSTVAQNKRTTTSNRPTQVPTQKKPATSSMATSIELTEKTKQSRFQQLKKKFPTVADTVINLSLEGTMYNVEMASVILKSSLDAVKSKPSSSATSTSATARPKSRERPSTSKSAPAKTKPASYMPVIFGGEDHKPKEYEPAISSTSSIDVPPQASYTKPVNEYKKREYKPIPRKMYQQRERAPVTGYKSANRCMTVGPDLSLVNGPNASLLQPDLVQHMGPNRSNRRGPQLSNRCGPVPSNAKGRAGINIGPMCAQLVHTAV